MNNKKVNNSSIKNTIIKQTPIDEYDNIDIEFNLIVPGEKYMSKRKNKDKGVDRREKIKTVVLYIAVTVSLMVVCYLVNS